MLSRPARFLPIGTNVKEKPRLKLILPLIVVAVVGVAVFQLGLLDRLTGSNEEAGAAIPPAAAATTGGSDTTTEPGQTETAPADTSSTDTTPTAPKASGPTGADRLDAALRKHKVVVMVVYTPDGPMDSIQIADARQGAEEAKAGFLSINASKEQQIADLAETYDLRATPTVLVFTRGPELAQQFVEFADHVTIAEAAQDAAHRS